MITNRNQIQRFNELDDEKLELHVTLENLKRQGGKGIQVPGIVPEGILNDAAHWMIERIENRIDAIIADQDRMLAERRV